MQLHINFQPFPVITTDRLILRNLRPEDKEDILAIRGNADTMQYIPRPLAKNLDDAAAVIEMITGFTEKNERINWAITEKGENMLIGVIGYVNIKPEAVRAEVGYVLHHEYRRRGIALEALNAVLDYGFNIMNCHSIEALVRVKNIASIQLLEKAGFIREGCMRDHIFHNGSFHDEALYSLIRD